MMSVNLNVDALLIVKFLLREQPTITRQNGRPAARLLPRRHQHEEEDHVCHVRVYVDARMYISRTT